MSQSPNVGSPPRIRTRIALGLSQSPLPIGLAGQTGARGQGRTDTGRYLKPLPLPVGLHAHDLQREQ